MTRKTVSFNQLLEYINKPEKKAGQAVLHNFIVDQDRPKRIEGEFLENARYLPERKNGVLLYHEILSFSREDRALILPEMLEDIARKYIELRAKGALAYAKAHFDTETPHIHIVISANEIGSRKKLRLSRRKFGEVKKEIERYQIKQYPFLSRSLVHLNEKEKDEKKVRQTRAEGERGRRLKQQGKKEPSKKEQVCDQVIKALTRSNSEKQFVENLKTVGLRLYTRGRQNGVQEVGSGRKYRFATIGLEKELTRAREAYFRVCGRKGKIEKIIFTKVKQKIKKMGYKEEIFETLEPLNKKRLSKKEHLREAELKNIKSLKRRRGRGKTKRLNI